MAPLPDLLEHAASLRSRFAGFLSAFGESESVLRQLRDELARIEKALRLLEDQLPEAPPWDG
jgi:hypothetical protein